MRAQIAALACLALLVGHAARAADYYGRIMKINAQSEIVEVADMHPGPSRSTLGPRTSFRVPGSTQITLTTEDELLRKGTRPGKFSDLKVGDVIHVNYLSDANRVASKILVTTVRKPAR